MAVETKRKAATFHTVTADGSTRDQPSMTVTTSDPDRVGDRIFMAGARTDRFMKNPILCWSHSYADHLPIGTVTALDILPSSIRATWRWLEGDPFAERVKNAWTQGVIRSASIGFLPTKTRPNKLGGLDVEAFELIEISLCAVPMNPAATRTLKALGLLGDTDPDPVLLRLLDDDPTYSVDPDDLRDALRRLLPEIVRAAVRREAEQALRRAIEKARGRVPDLNGAVLVGLGEPTKNRGARR